MLSHHSANRDKLPDLFVIKTAFKFTNTFVKSEAESHFNGYTFFLSKRGKLVNSVKRIRQRLFKENVLSMHYSRKCLLYVTTGRGKYIDTIRIGIKPFIKGSYCFSVIYFCKLCHFFSIGVKKYKSFNTQLKKTFRMSFSDRTASNNKYLTVFYCHDENPPSTARFMPVT